MPSFPQPVTDTVTLTNGKDTAVIKKLGWKAQQDAQMELQRQGLARMTTIGAGVVEVQQALRKAIEDKGGAEAIIKAVEGNPALKYDKATLLERGIVSWSLSDKPTADEIAELDPADADLLVGRVYELFRPKTEAEAKNS